MKFLKYIGFTFCFLLLSAWIAACSEDLATNDDFQQEAFDKPLKIRVNLMLPDIISTRTVAEDEEVLSVASPYAFYLFFFENNEDGIPSKMLAYKKIDEAPANNIISVDVEKEVVNTDNMTMLLMANVDSNILYTMPQTYSGLLAVTTDAAADNTIGKPFVMSGIVEENTDSDAGYKVDLKRSVAKISIENKASGFILESYKMYNGALNGYATAAIALDKKTDETQGTLHADKIYYSEATKQNFDNLTDADQSNLMYNYSYPTLSAGKDTQALDKAYFIVKGKYQNKECYYRIDLKNSTGYYDIDPNHWYQVSITKVNNIGYPTLEEAASRYMGQENDIEVEIHDHSANVMAMVADGQHELGVSRQVYYDPDATDSDDNHIYTNNEAPLTLRFYCATEGTHTGHIPTLTDGKLVGGDFKIEALDDWIIIGTCVIAEGDEQLSGVEGDDKESQGDRFQYTIKFDPEKIVEGEGTIRVTWLGMSIDVPVIYKSSYKPTLLLSSTSLTIHDTDNSTTLTKDDYWTFLSSELLGASASAMGDEKKRDDGFHFPVMYGDNSGNPWWYEYWFTLQDVSSVTAYSFKVDADMNSDVWNDLTFADNNSYTSAVTPGIGDFGGKLTSSSTTLYMKRDSKSQDYKYSKAVLTLRIYTSEETYTERKFNLYHTGFFHYDNYDSHNTWYYYEVVELSAGNYWLDRNIRATGNGLYIQADNNAPVFNSSDPYPFSTGDASGDYVRVAKSDDYNVPLFGDYKDICPRGFRIPTKSDFDLIRTSSNFHNEQRTDASSPYYTSYYDSSAAGRIYFPKGKFKYEGEWAGDGRSGYYWTQTVASGYEKTQIGHWVKALYLSGNSNTYIDADVDKYAMSLRCIAGDRNIAEKESFSTIGFKVKGATHVYLYYEDNEGVRSSLFAFPGKGVGTDRNTEQLFSHNSTHEPETLSVLFTYRDSNGKIWVIHPDLEKYIEDDFTIDNINNSAIYTKATEITDLSEIKGWPVKNDTKYFFSWENMLFVSGSRIYPYITKDNGGLKYFKYWINPNSIPGSYEQMNLSSNDYYAPNKVINLTDNIDTVYFQLSSDESGTKVSKVYEITPYNCKTYDKNYGYEFYLDNL